MNTTMAGKVALVTGGSSGIGKATATGPKALNEVLLHQPIGRLGTAEEVAQAVLWLCSDKASFILGTALGVDGGYLVV